MFSRRSSKENRRGVGGDGGTFNPFQQFTSSNGVELWLRGDLGITGTSTVSAWADQSGSGNHATQGSGPAQPAYTAVNAQFGGKPTVNGDGAATYLLANSLCNFMQSEDTGYTVIAALRQPTRSNGDRVWAWGSSGNGSLYAFLYIAAGTNMRLTRNTTVPADTAEVNFSMNVDNANPHVWEVEDTGTNGSFFINGNGDASNGGAINAAPPTALDRFSIFALINGGAVGNFGDVELAEFVVYNHRKKKPDASLRKRIRQYMAKRYGVTVA